MRHRLHQVLYILAALLGVWTLLPASAQTVISNNAADMANHIVMVADSTTPRTVTNLFTFDRGSSAPFAVGSSSAKVTYLDADKLDGVDGASYTTRTGTETLTNKTLTSPTITSPTFSGTVTITTGSWTPALAFGGGTTGITYTSRSGTYAKWGPMVFVQGQMVLSSKGSSTGAATITGLPSTVVTYGFGTSYWSSLGVSVSQVLLSATTGGTSFSLFKGAAATSATGMADTDFGGTTELNFSAVYLAAP